MVEKLLTTYVTWLCLRNKVKPKNAMVHIDSVQDIKCKIRLNRRFEFRFMLFSISFRLIFCNAFSKEGCDSKGNVITKQNYIFLSNQVRD